MSEASPSSDRPLDDFQASALVEHHDPLAEIGPQPPRLELAELHPPRHSAAAGQVAVLEVDHHVASRQLIAVGSKDPDRPLYLDALRVEVVTGFVGGDAKRPLREP